MKYLLFLLFLVPAFCFGQCIALEDSVFNNTATLITATTARINGDGSQGDVAGNNIKLRYVRVGFTDTVISTTLWPTVVRNLTGLQSGTQYVYYYSMNCGDGDVRQIGRYYFTTLTSQVVYATERSTVMPYYKADSGIVVPRIDTLLYRQPSTTGGNIVFRPADSVFYGWNKARWVPLMSSTAGIINKVDSVTVNSDSLFYWINGVAYGYILPTANNWSRTGNSGTVAGTNFLGTTDDIGLMFKTNNIQSGYIDLINLNTSLGQSAMLDNSTGQGNTSVGLMSLQNNTSGSSNAAIGSETLQANTTGNANTAFGNTALFNNIGAGNNNLALGFSSLYTNTTGDGNIGVGQTSGKYQTTLNNRLYINSIDRSDIPGDTTKSIIYGAQETNAVDQRLYLNSQLYLNYLLQSASSTDSVLVRDGNGQVKTRAQSAVGTNTNIYNTDGTLTGARTVTQATFPIQYSQPSDYEFSRWTNTGGTSSYVNLFSIDDGTIDLRFYNSDPTAPVNGINTFLDNIGTIAGHDISTKIWTIRKNELDNPNPKITVQANNITSSTSNIEMPDSSGTIPLRVKAGASTYSPDSKGTIDISAGVGTVTGSGTTGRATFWDGASSITSSANYLYTDAPTTGNGLSISNSAGTTGALVSINNTGTAAASNTKRGLEIVSSGANATASQTVTGQTISVTNTGTTNTNNALTLNASGGATANNALYVQTGFVGIGTAAPSTMVEVANSTASGYPSYPAITINNANSGGFASLFFNRGAGVGNIKGIVGLAATTNDMYFRSYGALTKFENGAATVLMNIDASIGGATSGNVAIGTGSTTGTAKLEITAGSATANTAPIELNSGTVETVIRGGLMEYNNAHYQSSAALNRYAMGGAIKDFITTVDNGTTVETDLYTYTTKASTLAADGEKLTFDIAGQFNDLTSTAQLQFYYASNNIGNTGALTVSAVGGWSARVIVIRTSSSTARTIVTVTTPGASTAVYTTQSDLTGITFTNTQIIKCTGTAAGATPTTGDIQAKLGFINWAGAANN